MALPKPSSPKKVDEHLMPATIELSNKDFLATYNKYDPEKVHVKHFPLDTLAYITSWNHIGYEWAMTFRSKFTYLSPVWYNLKFNLELEGTDLADNFQSWTEDIRIKPSKRTRIPKIVPRVLLEFTEEYFVDFFTDANAQSFAIDRITSEISQRGYDGIVLDMGSINFSLTGLSGFVQSLSSVLAAHEKILILAVPAYQPAIGQNLFTSRNLIELAPFVEKFHVMTYDYLDPKKQLAGTSSPLPWIHDIVNRLLPEKIRDTYKDKVMLGINFYGKNVDLKGNITPITSFDFVEIMKTKEGQFIWVSEATEHNFLHVDEGELKGVFFPTPMFVKRRLEVAKSYGLGVGIWELG
eukprot:CAMPEP_0184362276 /NCGR_PEP_ID=MMETSP1089-20130417/134033_1 /TAXON_ID=38269 ORGANISM="Gloeochaete wittrockiana, Strain SAG46.84" /NCGR_SAMPLE_ID=MMETSP1089 /ASSEMBLY_ACC=CAM_ASM_000445 /LENGTH=351 /DNA_ID=CAMNT_0026702289 /DNA_START=7 /DNA_END=1058 /DNA_ORIENTATION=+